MHDVTSTLKNRQPGRRGAIRILPSLLAADFGYLADGCRKAVASGGDALHIDIMDAHFVPNLSMGPDVVAMARRTVSCELHVHLMISRPDLYLKRFIEAGADTLLIHIEAECDVAAALREIRALGARPGITLNPETPAEPVLPVLGLVDDVLCMTVHPGYGGQHFMNSVMPKMRQLYDFGRSRKLAYDISVDGGIDLHTAPVAAAHGASLFIAGTSLFTAPDMKTAVQAMREAACRAHPESDQFTPKGI
jgi:ribulose-phosphate 3-epimerase